MTGTAVDVPPLAAQVDPDDRKVARGRRPDSRLVAWHVVTALGLATLAAVARWSELGPSSLWLDDAWVTVARKLGWGDIAQIGQTAPGFTAAAKVLFSLVGFSEVKAQLIPFAAAVAGPVVLYALLVRKRIGWVYAVLGGVLLATAPMHVTYATRVKPYTLEALFTIVLVWLGWSLLDDPRRVANWVAVSLASVAAVATSASLGVVAGAVLGVGFLRLLVDDRRRALQLGVPSVIAFGAFSLLLYLLVVSKGMFEALGPFWEDHYVPTDRGAREWVAGTWRLVESYLDGASTFPTVAVLVVVAASLVLVGIRRRWLALMLAVPFVGAYLAAVVELVPFGGGRTDVYTYPLIAVAVAVGLATLASHLPARAAVLPAVAAASIVVLALVRIPEPAAYPPEEVRPLVARLETDRRPGDVVLVYPGTQYAFVTYSDGDFEFREDATGRMNFTFDAVDDPRVVFLDQFRDDPEGYRPQVDAAATGERLWLVMSHIAWDKTALETIVGEAGYTRQLVYATDPDPPPLNGAELQLWVRVDPRSGVP